MDEEWADTSVLVREDVPVLTFTEDLITRDERTDGVLGLSLPMYTLRIQRDASDVRLSRGDMTWLCLLSSADAGTVEDRAMSMGLGGPEPGSLAWGHMGPWYSGSTRHMCLL